MPTENPDFNFHLVPFHFIPGISFKKIASLTQAFRMAFSMHSHSGQFCPGHAKDNLETILQTAILKGFQLFAFTEHMPRESKDDLYPEEVCTPSTFHYN